MKSVLVITPTIGAPELADCIRSVLAQDYENVEHLVVADGPKYKYPALQAIREADPNDTVKLLTLPYNTGEGGWYGGRLMAGMSFMVNHDYVMFLDQDNMIAPNHVSSLVRVIETGGYDWAYSLRKIYSKEGEFLCEDDCESLGWWPIGGNEKLGYLIDTSAYFFKNEFARATGHFWNWGWGGDRRYLQLVTQSLGHENFACSGLSTLHYRLGGNDGSVQLEMFEQGNALIKEMYGDRPLPWRDIDGKK
jgi:glycosyltransferase involved in cell wall biosynthesis